MKCEATIQYPDNIPEEWECKEKWYKENNYNDKLIISKDKPDGGIDSKEIEKIAKDRILENNSTR